VVIVWTLEDKGKIIGTVQCCIVKHNCTQLYLLIHAHTYEHLLLGELGPADLGLDFFCAFFLT